MDKYWLGDTLLVSNVTRKAKRELSTPVLDLDLSMMQGKRTHFQEA